MSGCLILPLPVQMLEKKERTSKHTGSIPVGTDESLQFESRGSDLNVKAGQAVNGLAYQKYDLQNEFGFAYLRSTDLYFGECLAATLGCVGALIADAVLVAGAPALIWSENGRDMYGWTFQMTAKTCGCWVLGGWAKKKNKWVAWEKDSAIDKVRLTQRTFFPTGLGVIHFTSASDTAIRISFADEALQSREQDSDASGQATIQLRSAQGESVLLADTSSLDAYQQWLLENDAVPMRKTRMTLQGGDAQEDREISYKIIPAEMEHPTEAPAIQPKPKEPQ